MKKLPTFFFVALFALCLISMTSCKKQIAGSEQHSTIGNINASGETIVSDGSITVAGGGSFEELGAKTTYTFNAVQQRNGTTKGNLVLHFRAGGGSMHVTIDCLRLFGDNQATLSGVITKVSVKGDEEPPPFIFVGGRVSFTVQDNGEAESDSADLLSDIGELIEGVPASCADEWPVYLAGANVQIIK